MFVTPAKSRPNGAQKSLQLISTIPPRNFRGLIAAVTPLLAVAPLLAGSGCDNRPQRVPVAGQVLIDGKPLNTGFVRVIPENARPAVGQIEKDGRFRLTTFDGEDGCVLGKHQVEIVARQSQGYTTVKWLTPRKYQDVSTSELTVDVQEPIEDWTIELSWNGEAPFVEQTFSEGDAPSVGTLPDAEEATP